MLCFTLFPVVSEATSWSSAVWKLSAQEKQRLLAGQVVTHVVAESAARDIRHVQALLRCDAPAELIFSVVRDFESLPEYIPHLEHTETLELSTTGAVVNYTLALPFGVMKRYRLKLSFDKQGESLKMSWYLVPWQGLKPEETLVHTAGYWMLEPMADGAATMLHYETTTDPGSVPFGLGWVIDYLTTQTIVALLEKTKERAEKQWVEQRKVLN